MNRKILIGVGAVVFVCAVLVFGVFNSLPGGMLYGLKIGALENFQSGSAGEGRERAEWHLKKAAERLDEASRAASKRSFDTDAQSVVLLNYNAHMAEVEAYITQLQEEENLQEVKEFSITIGQALAAKTELLVAAQTRLREKDPEHAGSVDFLLLRAANTVTAAAILAARTGIEDEAPDTSHIPPTDEEGNPL